MAELNPLRRRMIEDMKVRNLSPVTQRCYVHAVAKFASARGEWRPGGSKMAGADAYATSKQCILAAAMAFARETPRLRFNALEPGFTPNTGLARDANAFLRFLASYLLPLLAPHIKYWSTPKRAAHLATKVLIDASGQTGIYYDEGGRPMLGSALVRDPTFQDRVVAETRALLATAPGPAAIDAYRYALVADSTLHHL